MVMDAQPVTRVRWRLVCSHQEVQLRKEFLWERPLMWLLYSAVVMSLIWQEQGCSSLAGSHFEYPRQILPSFTMLDSLP